VITYFKKYASVLTCFYNVKHTTFSSEFSSTVVTKHQLRDSFMDFYEGISESALNVLYVTLVDSMPTITNVLAACDSEFRLYSINCM
jgi:hypothetical protein